MSAVNVVRFRVKAGQEDAFVKAHQVAKIGTPGFRGAELVKTGERSYCFVGRWDSTDALVAARPAMIAILDSFRHTLDDLGGGMGVTDPVSGEVVVDIA
ncbi:MAG: antibiotic biosynthesis monooxygenase [Alphaproteobacteria bacterium]